MQRTLETCHGAVTGVFAPVGMSLELFFNTETVSVWKNKETRLEWRRGTYFALQYQNNKRRFSIIDGGVVSAWRMCQHTIATTHERFLNRGGPGLQRSILRYQGLSNDLLARMHTIDQAFAEVERVLVLTEPAPVDLWSAAARGAMAIKDRPYVERAMELVHAMQDVGGSSTDLGVCRAKIATLRTIQTLAMNIISPISFALHEKQTEAYDAIRAAVMAQRAKLLRDVRHISLHEDFAVREQLTELGRRLREGAKLQAIQCTAEQAMRLLAS